MVYKCVCVCACVRAYFCMWYAFAFVHACARVCEFVYVCCVLCVRACAYLCVRARACFCARACGSPFEMMGFVCARA